MITWARTKGKGIVRMRKVYKPSSKVKCQVTKEAKTKGK